jgi:hypothetical protein
MQLVVIGHGKSTEGKGWGPRIDASDCVLRMWNCHWQPAEDYGTRYDFGLLETHRRLLKLYRDTKPPKPAQGWIVSRLDQYAGWQADIPQPYQLFDQREWINGEGAAIGGMGVKGKWELTRGSLAACWAMTRQAKPGATVVLIGFDNIHAQIFLPIAVAFSDRYQADPAGAWIYTGYEPGVTKDGNHDVAAERLLLEAVAVARGVKLVFAQDHWQ